MGLKGDDGANGKGSKGRREITLMMTRARAERARRTTRAGRATTMMMEAGAEST